MSGPIKTQTTNKENKQKTHKTTNKTKTTKHREVGSLPAVRHKMHDDILCVILSSPENEATLKTVEIYEKMASV